MAVNDDLAARLRAVLGAAGAVREVKMFGGLCFMHGRRNRRSLPTRTSSPRFEGKIRGAPRA